MKERAAAGKRDRKEEIARERRRETQRERDAENDRVRTMHPYAGVRDIQRERAQARERREIGMCVCVHGFVFARQQDKEVECSGHATRHEQQHREIEGSGHATCHSQQHRETEGSGDIATEQQGETGSD